MANPFGLDYMYFERWIDRIMKGGGFKNYKPHECARELARMSRAADENVLHEPEFSQSLLDKIYELEQERDQLRQRIELEKNKSSACIEIVEAVAHVGIDFGYGCYELNQGHINTARELIMGLPPTADKKVNDEVIKLLDGISSNFSEDYREDAYKALKLLTANKE